MGKVFIAGLINIETTLQVDTFPIPYFPVRYPFYGVNSSVSGVGYNIAKALTILGDEVYFASLIGQDLAGDTVRQSLLNDGIANGLILSNLQTTAQSVILYDGEGQRQIHTDLKDIQERTFPLELARKALVGCDLAVLCDINFARPLLVLAGELGIPIATDAHTLGGLDDAYHQDFLQVAHIVFISDEKLSEPPEIFAKQMIDRFGTQIVVIGLGSRGALLSIKGNDTVTHFPTVKTRPIVNTIGAGDALFSCFVHEYVRHGNPGIALARAMVFASYKIGSVGAADGFLTDNELDEWVCKVA